MASILDFLAELFSKSLGYQTINLYRSAISSCHEKIDNYAVGEHPFVKRLMRGIFRSRPPRPRYGQYIWKVDKVLAYLESLGSNRFLSLKQLTLKLTMLLALTAAKRCNELSRLDCRYMHFSGTDKVQFTIPHLVKNGKPNSMITFLRFKENRKLCVLECLNEYLVKTEQYRESREQNLLLLSFIKPHKPIKPCSVARWLKLVMMWSGIDVSVYKAHSTRSAACSKVINKGVSCAEILRTADWSKQSTFTKFYNRELSDDQNEFGTVVLRL